MHDNQIKQSGLTGDHVVAVTTTLDSTVLEVEHLRAGEQKRAWLPFACGAALAVIAALAFGKAVSLAEANEAAQHAWLAAEMPAADFRPANLSIAYDLLAGFGLLGSIFCFGFGIWSISRRERSQLVAGGESADIPMSIASPVTLVEATEAGPVIAPVASMALSVMDAEGEHTEDEAMSLGLLSPHGDGRLRLAAGARALYDNGSSRIVVEQTAAPRKGTAAAAFGIEGRAAQFFAGSAIVHAAILALLWSVPPDSHSLALDNQLSDARLVSLRNPTNEPPKEELSESGGQEGAEGDKTAELMSPPDGVTGKPEETATTGRYTIKKRSDSSPPQLARSEAIDRARRSGVLEVLNGGDRFANITVGTADFSNGFSEADVRGGLNGDVGAVHGSWGSWGVYGGVGTGPGYGMAEVGSLRWGNGGNGTIGTCRSDEKCSGGEWGTGTGKGPMGRRHKKSKPDATIGKAKVGGADPSIIRRYIRRKLPQIRHCYEKQLLVSPNLSGTVSTQFVISPQGKVMGTKAAGTSSAALNSCVAHAVSSIQFPKFGHLVNVSYPFNFRPAG